MPKMNRFTTTGERNGEIFFDGFPIGDFESVSLPCAGGKRKEAFFATVRINERVREIDAASKAQMLLFIARAWVDWKAVKRASRSRPKFQHARY
jgi:hypothetical protein